MRQKIVKISSKVFSRRSAGELLLSLFLAVRVQEGGFQESPAIIPDYCSKRQIAWIILCHVTKN